MPFCAGNLRITKPRCVSDLTQNRGIFFVLLFAGWRAALQHVITGRDVLPLVKQGSLFLALAFPERCVFFAQQAVFL